MPSTRPLLYNRSADLLPAPPFSGDSVGVSAVASGPFDFAFKRDGSSDGPRASSVRPNFHRCAFVQIASLPVLQRGSFPFLLFFPALFLFFSSALDSIGSLSSVAGTLRLPPFSVSSFTGVSTSPGSYLARLARSIEAPIMASHVFSCFVFTWQKFGPSSESGIYVWTESRTHSGIS